MKKRAEIADKVRRDEPLPLPLAVLLSMATVWARAGMWVREKGPRFHVDARVISYGNLTAGGAGKTPAVIERARQEIDAGNHVAVLTRGYGSSRRSMAVRGSQAKRPAALAASIGDEPALILKRVPEAVVVKNADRIAGALTAIRDFHCDTLILDDGYQYLQLEREENILVIDATNPFGNGRLIPRGILREPVTALDRATHFLLTRCDQCPQLPILVHALEDIRPGAPIRKTRHAPTHLWRLDSGETAPLETLQGQPVRAVCGIGNPEAFFATLAALGAELVDRRPFPDHSAIPPSAFVDDGVLTVTTEKDAMRLGAPPCPVHALAIELQDYDG